MSQAIQESSDLERFQSWIREPPILDSRTGCRDQLARALTKWRHWLPTKSAVARNKIRDGPNHSALTTPPNFWGSAPDPNVPTLHANNEGRGFRWAEAGGVSTGFNTILPPNKELCPGPTARALVTAPVLKPAATIAASSGNANFIDAVLPPSSRHQGGCRVLMADGAVKFVTGSIEAGTSTSSMVGTGAGTLPVGGQSPFGLWGALGNRASSETVSGF